jgi:hypothetical protein
MASIRVRDSAAALMWITTKEEMSFSSSNRVAVWQTLGYAWKRL